MSYQWVIDLVVQAIAPLEKTFANHRLTFLARCTRADLADADVLVTSDQLPEIRAAIEKRIAADGVQDGVSLIAAERDKQRAKWNDAHDDEHDGGMLAGVAAILAARLAEECDSVPVAVYVDGEETREDPWGLAEKHAADPIRRLQIAGALIAAEIDRRLRVQAKEKQA